MLCVRQLLAFNSALAKSFRRSTLSAIAKAPLRIDAVHLFVCLSPKCVGTQKRDYLKN